MKTEEIGEDWPKCYRCGKAMWQVVQKGTNTYYRCFETPNGVLCGHVETSV